MVQFPLNVGQPVFEHGRPVCSKVIEQPKTLVMTRKTGDISGIEFVQKCYVISWQMLRYLVANATLSRGKPFLRIP